MSRHASNFGWRTHRVCWRCLPEGRTHGKLRHVCATQATNRLRNSQGPYPALYPGSAPDMPSRVRWAQRTRAIVPRTVFDEVLVVPNRGIPHEQSRTNHLQSTGLLYNSAGRRVTQNASRTSTSPRLPSSRFSHRGIVSSVRKPKALKKGSTIGIVAPASNVDPEAFSKGVSSLEAAGYQVRYSDAVFARACYFAGPHQQRARDLMNLFQDPAVNAIICARGGYGCHHLLPYLNASLFQANPKVLVGYSDATVLLQYLENQCNLIAFHGPMVAREFALGEPYYNSQNFTECVSRLHAGQRITAPGLETLQGGTAQGRLTGGCLSLLTATLGTKYEIQTQDRILFFEDVNAKPYQVDRMLMHLKLAGKLDAVRGIIFGEMLNCTQSPDQDYQLQQIVFGILEEFRLPILYGLPSGHTSTGSLTLPFGVDVLLNADGQYLELLEPAVE
jgi:muramoyltetrapeptide carboxypeptidase